LRGSLDLDGSDARSEGGAVLAEPIALHPRATSAQSFAVVGLSCLRQIAQNVAGVRHRDAEAVHQLRIGLRRFRAALSLFKGIFRVGEVSPLKRELRWLTEQLGPARDYDVLLESLAAHDRQVGDGLDELETRLTELRLEAFEVASRAAASERSRQLVVAAALWLVSRQSRMGQPSLPELDRRGTAVLARAVLESHSKTIAKGLGRIEHMAVDERHQLRIAVKKLHYGAEFFATLFPKASDERRALVRILGKLQEVLGRLNDIAVHQRLMAELEPSSQGADAARRTATARGSMAGRTPSEVARLIEAAHRARLRLRGLRPFWK